MGPQAASNVTTDVPAALIRTLEGNIAFWSPAMEQRYGFAAEEAVGQQAHRLLQTRSWQAIDEIEATLQARHSWVGGLIHQRADETPVIAANRWQLHRIGADVFVTELHADIVAADTPEAGQLADVIATIAQELSQPLAALGGYIGGVQHAIARAWPDRSYLEHGMDEAGKQLARAGELLQRVRTLGENLRSVQLRSVHARLTEALEVGERVSKNQQDIVRASKTLVAQSVLARRQREKDRIRRAAGKAGAVSVQRAAVLGNVRLLERLLNDVSNGAEPTVEQALRQLLDDERAALAAIEQPVSESPS
jgi:PAS domain S-box-containing protein